MEVNLIRGPRRYLNAGGLTLVCIGIASCAATNVPTLAGPSSAPERELQLYEDEKELWDKAERLESSIDCGKCDDALYRDAELDAYLQSVADRLLASSTNGSDVNVRVRVLGSPLRNAFVLPNGAVYFSTGMLDLMDNEDQLATVLGHELVHFLHRHSLRDMRHKENRWKWTMAIGTLLAGPGVDLSPLLAISSLGGYSRELEAEADDLGFRMMVKAGYRASETPVVFEKLLAFSGSEDDGPYFFASHPKMQDRLANYRELSESFDGSGRFTSIRNPNEFVALIDTMRLDNVVLAIEFGMRKDAGAALDRFVARHPENARAYFLKGELARNADGEDAALAMYAKAATLRETPVEALRAAGLILRRRGDHDSATKYFDRYLDESPDAVDAPIIRGYLDEAREVTGNLTIDNAD